MKVTLELDLTTRDGSTPLFNDIERELRALVHNQTILWYDTSLDQLLFAEILVASINEK